MSSIRVAIGRSGELDSLVSVVLQVATLPTKVTPDFFVVGGPVQPDRACYVRRSADETLLEAVASHRFACVLAPRATGKSSLMGRAIRRLRAEGQLAAVVDLTQIGTRSERVDSARWHYSIAYRICRELRLKVDLQDWWHERGLLLNEQRLVEFFWDIVLANTTDAVTVFFDEAERAIELAYAGELFAALHSCYMRRVSEPDYARLNFVVLGAASPAQLCPDPSVSVFAEGIAVRLDDFTLEECQSFARGLSPAADDTGELFERVYSWTHGQPYLTQKLVRGVARRGGQASAVDPVAHELFVAAGIAREEPYLAHMRNSLSDSSRGRQAHSILKRLTKGGEVIDDRSSPSQQLLHFGGFVSSDDNGMLRFRNRIVEQVFEANWSQTAPVQSWQRPAVAAAIAAVALIALSFWYVRILPRPYIDTLTFVSSDYALASQAHRRLRNIPGFGRRADRMLADVIVRQSTEAETIEAVRTADAILRELPDHDQLADQLMAAYWLRQSERAAHRGERDAALAHAIEAVSAGSERAVAVARNLIDGDYSELERSFNVDSPVLGFEVDWERGHIVGIDQTQRLFRVPLGTAPVVGPNPVAAGARPVFSSLSALQQVGVTRGLFVDEPGRAGSFQLTVTVDHERTSDLLVRLRAPSGAAAETSLPQRDGGLEQFVFTASAENGLSRLADEAITGQWELTVFDRLSGETGRLISWGMLFPGVSQDWPDDPVDGIPLPDPVRTEQVSVALSGDGRTAVAIPSRADVRGAASVWDIGSGEMIADLPLADRANVVQFIAPDFLLVVGAVRAMLWRVDSSEPIAEIVAARGFAARPAVSRDGRFFAVAESVPGQTRVTLHSVADGSRVSSFDTDPWTDWALAANADYLAVVDGTRRGRLLDPMTGEPKAEFFHELGLDRIVAAGEQIVAVDTLGQIVAWPFAQQSRALTPVDGIEIGSSPAAESIELSADGKLFGFVDANGLVNLSTLDRGYRRAVFDHGQSSGLGIRLSPDNDRLVSAAGTRIRSWRVPGDEPIVHDFGDVSAVALDAGGTFAVLGYRSGKVQLLRGLPGSIDRAVAAPAVDYVGHRGVVTSLAVDASGEFVASGASDGVVRVWNAANGTPKPYLLRHPAGPVDALAFSPDGRWLVSTAAGSARVFDLGNGQRVNEIEVDGPALAVDFAPDSSVVAVGDSAGNIVLAAPDGSEGVLTIRGRSPITALRYADSSSVLASGTNDGNVVIWDTLEVRAMEGAYSLSAPIRWINFLEGFADVYVQSGAWLHRLDRSAGELRVNASSLLPNRFRNDPALTRIGNGTVRTLAHAGGGRLVMADVRVSDMAVSDMAMSDRAGVAFEPSSDSPESDRGVAGISEAFLAERDWGRVLGLEIDPVTGSVRPSRP